ncbi:MAG: porin family protein [Planctomycetota bacterium]
MQRIASIACLSLLPACAFGPTEFSASGLQVAAGVNRTWDDFHHIDQSDFSADSDETTGYDARVSYRFLDHLAIEVSYENLSEFNLGAATVGVQTLMAQGKGYLFTGRFQPYGLLGIGYVDADLDTDIQDLNLDHAELAYRAGIGMEVYIIPLVYVFAEGAQTWPTSNLNGLDFFTASLGVGLHF